VHELAAWLEQRADVAVVDVREPFEWLDGHIADAIHVPMGEAVRRAGEVPVERPKAVICAGGLRSSTAISALKRHVPGPWFNVTGGMGAWSKAGYGVRRPGPPASP
jgi:rhodanese-related sulfurtransferase